MSDSRTKRRGRKPGQLVRMTCFACGIETMGRGATKYSRCDSCRKAGRRGVLPGPKYDKAGGTRAMATVSAATARVAMKELDDVLRVAKEARDGIEARLQAALDAVGFDPARDRLFSVGDLVDRGPESEKALAWLAQPWFHAVRGNHEDVAIRYAKGNPVDPHNYSINGGDWFMSLCPDCQKRFGAAFDELPYAIEVETEGGIVGLVHANVPTNDWNELPELLLFNRYTRDRVMWDRGRIESMNTQAVEGVRAVVVGHTPLDRVTVLGNVHHIDTAGWHATGHFTLLSLETLEVA